MNNVCVLLKFGFCLTYLDDTNDLCLIIYAVYAFVNILYEMKI